MNLKLQRQIKSAELNDIKGGKRNLAEIRSFKAFWGQLLPLGEVAPPL